MAKYIESFLVPVPKKNLKAYLKMAKLMCKVCIDHGALEYVESIAADIPKGKITSFPRSVKMKANETMFFSYIVYKSRKHRDSAFMKIMNDPRLAAMGEDMPFDGMRMIWGGFEQKVVAKSK